MPLEVVLGSIRSDAPSRVPTPLGKEPAGRDRSVRILVVDDEPSICKALSAALSRAGYDVATAQSGEAALATVRAEHVDVLLIDLRIPDMRGDIIFEVAAATQPQLAYQTVFMTGDITEYRMPDPAAKDPHTPLFDKQGMLWFTLQNSNMIGRLNPATGEIKLATAPTPRSGVRPRIGCIRRAERCSG